MSDAPVIEVSGATKVYGVGETRVAALRGVDLQIGRGELLAIMGPSGSGKSTLLSLLGAVDTPSSGAIVLEGVDLASLNDDRRTLLRRRRIGFVFQTFNLLPVLTAVENVALPLELDGLPAREAERRATEALALVEMSHRHQHLPGMMSGGEQQRVAVARALVTRPAILLADEPTGNLDSVNSRRVIQLLRKLVDDEGQTVVIVTHDPSLTSVADRVIRLRDGMIVHGDDGDTGPSSVDRTVGEVKP